MNIEYPEGATPLDADVLSALIPNLTPQREFNEFEARNILDGEQWARRARGENRDVLRVPPLRRLHLKMFDRTWRWAGQFRHTQTNIGVAASEIAVRLEQLCGNSRFRINLSIADIDEIAAEYHHSLV